MARIALDIDSTLHHYWDLLEDLARERHGIELPYAEQSTWTISGLSREQLKELVAETHSETKVVGAEPYPDAVETVRAWHEQGHFIHVTSHRAESARAATERWLERIGMPYDDLHCSYDKLSRCVELEIDVLVDDSPVNLSGARAAGMAAATIVHPWNAELVYADDGVIGARDWRELRERLEPLVNGRGPG